MQQQAGKNESLVSPLQKSWPAQSNSTHLPTWKHQKTRQLSATGPGNTRLCSDMTTPASWKRETVSCGGWREARRGGWTRRSRTSRTAPEAPRRVKPRARAVTFNIAWYRKESQVLPKVGKVGTDSSLAGRSINADVVNDRMQDI